MTDQPADRATVTERDREFAWICETLGHSALAQALANFRTNCCAEAVREMPVSRDEANELQDILRTLTNSGTALKTSARELVAKLAEERERRVQAEAAVKRWEDKETSRGTCCYDNEQRAERAEQRVESLEEQLATACEELSELREATRDR